MSSLNLIELRRSVAASAAFRLTLRFAAIFVLCLGGLGLVGTLTMRTWLYWDSREEIAQSVAELDEAFRKGGEAAFAAKLDKIMREEGDLLIGRVEPDGTLLVGTLAPPDLSVGWGEYLPPGTDEDEILWTRTARLADGTWLVVAASSENYHDVEELIGAGAIWIVVIALPLALVSGAALSLSVMKRLSRIAEVAERVGLGQLERRAPLSSRQDEFDRLSSAINAMLDRIEALQGNLRNVTVGIAHELRTPLARVRNRLSDLQRDNGSCAEKVGAIIDEIDSLLATFDALLKIGQIDTKAGGAFESVDLSELVTEIAADYEPVAAEKGKQLIAEAPRGATLNCHRALIVQMISNLIENAIDHTPPGTRIRIGLDPEAGGPCLFVEDNGPGIPPEESERIFQRFARLGRSSETPGNGLGLSLVRSICNLHGFRVAVAPSQRGARFEVTMPAAGKFRLPQCNREPLGIQ